MKNIFRRISACLAFFTILVVQTFGYCPKVYADTTLSNYIQEDAFVNSASPDTIMSKSNSELIVGKQRHMYMKFNLSSIDMANTKSIILSLNKKNNSNTLVYNECENYLRDKDTQKATEEEWSYDNITYNNRPLDLDDAATYQVNMVYGEQAFSINLTKLFKKAIDKGRTEISVHFSTLNVNDAKVSATDIYSTRSSEIGKVPAITIVPKVQGYIQDDAFVNGEEKSADTIMVEDNASNYSNLIVGKQRHSYMKFNLSSIENDIKNDAIEKIVLKLNKRNGSNTLIYNECENYLRDKNTGESTEEEWSYDSITYNTRPKDLTNVITYEASMPYGNQAILVDLTQLFKTAINLGRTEISVHFTTSAVDDTSISASDIYSSRDSDKAPYLNIVYPNIGEANGIAGNKIGDYIQNSLIPTKIFKMKEHNVDNSYVKVDSNGTLKANASVDEASTFALYTYEYSSYDGEVNDSEGKGPIKTTYVIKCIDTDKYLSIQNYFSENDSEKPYYNKVADSTYEIKAVADSVSYNEKFNVNHYENGGYYTIYSHLDTHRDDPTKSSLSVVKVNEEKMTSTLANIENFCFDFIDVSNKDELEVVQKVSGTSAILKWKAINDDNNTSNYSVSKDAEITEENGYFTAKVNGLEQGESTSIAVTHIPTGKTDTISVRIFNHPGMLLSNEDLDNMKTHIENKEEPWYSDFLKLQSTVPDNLSSYDFDVSSKVHEGVGRGTQSGHANILDFEQSASAAYFNALQWVITDDTRYADKAVDILTSWAENLKVVDGRDRILGASINSYKLANAAEIVKYYNGGYSGYSDEDFSKLQDMMINVIYPVIQDFGSPMIANGNWDVAAMLSMISIGVLCDDSYIYDKAVNAYQDIHVNGSIEVYVSPWGQTVESARDQAHAQLGVGYMGEICQVAYKQGDDLYGLKDNRLAKAFEWAARYNLFEEPTILDEDSEENKGFIFKPLSNVFGTKVEGTGYWTYMDYEQINRGELRPIYELALSHYKNIPGVETTWMSKAAEAMRPQGYVHNDNLNFGTLTNYNGEQNQDNKFNEPYFKIRTRLEPWYQLKFIKSSNGERDGEKFNSYFAPNEQGILTADSKREVAPYYKLENNEDGTYSIRCTSNNKYLSIKEDKKGEYNIIKADSDTITYSEKFTLYSNGASSYFLRSPLYDNRIVCVEATDSSGTVIDVLNSPVSNSDADSCTLTMYLGTSESNNISDLTKYERLILVYNTINNMVEPNGITVKSVSKLDNIIVEQGIDLEDLDLPQYIDVELSDNTTTSAAVKWDSGDPEYDKNEIGKYKFTGDLKLPDGIVNPDEYKATVDVIVKSSEIGEESLKIIDIDSINDIYVEQGTTEDEIDFPQWAEIKLSDNTTTSAAIEWNESEPRYDSEKDGSYKFIGKIILPDNVENPYDVFAKVNVIITNSGKTDEDDADKIKTVKINGKYRVGQTLNVQLLDINGVKIYDNLDMKYRWYRADNINFDGQILVGSDSTYTLKSTDKNKYIKLDIEYSGKTFEDITSKISGNSSSSSHHSSSNSNNDEEIITESNNSAHVEQPSNNINNSTSQTDNNLTGWKRDVNNNWVYYNNEKAVTGWNKIDNSWYLFDLNGVMKIGWNQDRDKWYYLKDNGSMQTGWLYNNDNWYYLNQDGSMHVGWKYVNGQWYYLYTDGSMAFNTQIDRYKLDERGAWINN